MTRKKAIALSVAGVFASPLFAYGAATTQAADVGHWEVITPSSVNEAAQHLTLSRSHLGGPAAGSRSIHSIETAAAPVEVITPSSVDESAPWLTAEDRRKQRMAPARAKVVSLPNPQTPWSPNEVGENRYGDDLRSYRQHVASVEQARLAAAASYEPAPVAVVEAAPVSKETSAEIDRLLTGSQDRPSERDRESVATASPALVDSRQTATTELRVDPGTTDRPTSDSAASPVRPEADRAVQGAPTPAQTGANAAPPASSSVSGSSVEASVVAAAPFAAAPAPAAELPAAVATPQAEPIAQPQPTVQPEAIVQPAATSPAQ